MTRSTLPLLLLAAAGCERAGATVSVELAVPEVTVTMLDPGPEPRAPLVGAAPVGAHAVFDSTSSVDYEFAGTTHPGSTTHERFTVRNLEVAPDGTVHGVEVVTAASLEPHPGALPVAHPIDPAGYIGRSLEFWRDARGRTTQPTRVTFATDASFEDGRAIELMQIAPEQAVGIGARWHEHVVLSGRTAELDCELVARTGDHVQLRTTFHAERSVKLPDGPHPASERGTIEIAEDLGALAASLHKNATLTMHSERGDVIGHETLDIVPGAP